VSIDPLQEAAYVTQRYAITQGEEPGVVISIRDYDRCIERLGDCKQGGSADLWLAGVLAGALTLPAGSTGTRDVL
jgi:hypothetical protein